MAGEGFLRLANGTRYAADLWPVWELLPSCYDVRMLISCCIAIAAVCCSWFFGSCVAGFLRLANGTRYAADLCFNFIRSIANLADQISQKVRDQLLECKSRLASIVRSLVRSRLMAAVDKRDHPTIVRLVRVFRTLGLEEEGLQIFVAYLRTVIALRSRSDFEHLKEIAEQGGADFVTCLTNLFNDIVLAVEKNDKVLRSLCGKDGIVYAIYDLQKECYFRGTQVLNEYMDYRKLSRLASEINSYSRNLAEGPDPIEVEEYIEEILSLTRRGEDYTKFMVSKIRAVYPEFAPRATKDFRSGSFNTVVQDLTGFYVILEKFFMVKNVRKAIAMDEHLDNSLITSMVGDVFYVLKISCMRSISTGSSNLVIAVLIRAISVLGYVYYRSLRRKLPDTPRTMFHGGDAQLTATYISTFNNVDVSADYVLRLRQKIEEQCAEVFPAPADREKVKSCLSELGEINNTYKRLLSSELESLMPYLYHQIRPVLYSVETVSYELSDAEYEDNEVNDPWVQNLLHGIETDIAWLQPLMTSNNYDSVVDRMIKTISRVLYNIMMRLKRFNQLGGLQLDREVRALVNYFSEMSQRPVRDKFARLSQMTTILNFERVSEILDFWGENARRPMTWLLTPAEVRWVLGRRIDFKPEDIAALRL